MRRDEKLVQVSIKIACINDQKKPVQMPTAFVSALEINGFWKKALRRNIQ